MHVGLPKVRKLGRYLRKHPRQVLWFAWQDGRSNLKVYVDTDCAGCPRTRRSTNGGLVMHGSHLLKTWATTQTVVALSSGEAEYRGAVKGTCEALGIKGIAKDMGFDLSITFSTDSSAAKLIATGKGLEKVKHPETRTLWAQDKIDEGKVLVEKTGGGRNVADFLTQHFSSSRLRPLLATSQSQSWKEGIHWPHSCRINRNVASLMICSLWPKPATLACLCMAGLCQKGRGREGV